MQHSLLVGGLAGFNSGREVRCFNSDLAKNSSNIDSHEHHKTRDWI